MLINYHCSMKLNQFPNTYISLLHDSEKKPEIHLPSLKMSDIPPKYGAFFSVNGVNGARRKENLSHVTGVYCDFDYTDEVPELQDLPVDWMDAPPSIVNRSKNGYHCIWLLPEPIEVNDENRDDLILTVEGINRWFVTNWGSDNACVDVARLLRIPGTEHRKNPDEPFTVTTVHESDDRYTLERLTKLFPPVIKEVVEPVYGALTDDADARISRMLEIDKIRRLWNGELEGDDSSLDQSLCNHLAFWLAKDPIAMEQAWLRSPIGQREKTQKRADYRKLTIDKAVATTRDVYTPREIIRITEDVITDINLDTLMSVIKNKGKDNEYVEYLSNDENIIRILQHYKIAKHDLFRNKSYLRINNEWKLRSDGTDGEVYSWLVNKFDFLSKVQLLKVAKLLNYVQYRNTYDSAQDALNAIKWDGEARLDIWLHKTFRVEDDLYHREVGRKWLMGMAARILNPGSKFDGVLIVHGGQKVGKSTVFLILAGALENHVEFTDLHVKEMAQDMQGKLIVEFSEGAIFSKADSETLKSIVTRQTDTFRVPYEAHARDFYRRCVFAVTANNDDLLKDSTGGRRWWAIELPDDMRVYPPRRQVDFAWIEEHRDQLLAEAAHRVKAGEEYWEIDDDELRKRQKSITATEQDEDLFHQWYHGLRAGQQNEGITVREAYVGAYKNDYRGEPLDITTVSIKKADEMRVARILKKIGLEKKKTNGVVVWRPGQDFDRDYTFRFPKTDHEYRDTSF